MSNIFDKIWAIKSVTDKEGNKKHEQLIGRYGKLISPYYDDEVHLERPIYLEYLGEDLKGACLRTSWVQDYKVCDCGQTLFLETDNSLYYFEVK